MNKVWKISLAIFSVLLILSSYPSISEIDPVVIKEWNGSATDTSTFLDVHGSILAQTWWSPPHTFKAKGDWVLSSTAYAEAVAYPYGDNAEFHVVSWLQASGDLDQAPIPSKDNIDQDRGQWDSEGRDYNYDSHTHSNGGSEVAYKKQVVSSTVENWWEHFNPWAKQVIRSFNFSIYRSYIIRHPTSPSGLTSNPYMQAEISSDSNTYLNQGIGSATISSP